MCLRIHFTLCNQHVMVAASQHCFRMNCVVQKTKCTLQAPAILFVDEFDALGAARGAQSSGDESASIINELLVRIGLPA
jgi:AAA+ superfamily predicted ATPase